MADRNNPNQDDQQQEISRRLREAELEQARRQHAIMKSQERAEEDARHNVGESYSQGLFDGQFSADDSESGGDGDSSESGDQAPQSGEEAVDDARKGETQPEESGSFDYGEDDQSGSGKAGPARGKASWRDRVKRSGPLTFLLLFLALAGGVSSTIMVPVMVLNHVQEGILETMNTMSSANDSRMKVIQKAKMGASSIDKLNWMRKKKRFGYISDNQLRKLEEQGFLLKTKKGIRGNKIESIGFMSRDGTQTLYKTPADFKKALDPNSPHLEMKNSFHKGTMGWIGATRDKIMTRVKTYTKAKFSGLKMKLFGSSGADSVDDAAGNLEEGLDNQMNTTSSGGQEGLFDSEVAEKAAEGYKVETGKDAPEPKKVSTHGLSASSAQAIAGNLSLLAAGMSLATNVCDAGRGFVSLIDNARAVLPVELVRYASMILSVIDSVKAGQSSEEAIAHVANKFMQQDAYADGDQTRVSPTGADSYGVRYVTTGKVDGPIDVDESASQYHMGLVSRIPVIRELYATFTHPAVNSACGFFTSEGFRVVSAAVSIAAAAFSVASSITTMGAADLAKGAFLGIVRGAASGMSKAFALKAGTKWFVTNILNREFGVATGSRVHGEDMGNALVAGSGRVFGLSAQEGGNAPGDKPAVVSYLAKHQEYIAERGRQIRATTSPFDMSTRHTFVGSILHSSIPFVSQMSNLSGLARTFLTLGWQSFGSILPASQAQQAYALTRTTEATLEVCSDPDYVKFDVGFDPYCNPIMIMSTKALEMAEEEIDFGPNEVLEYISQTVDKGGKAAEEWKNFWGDSYYKATYKGNGRFQMARSSGGNQASELTLTCSDRALVGVSFAECEQRTDGKPATAVDENGNTYEYDDDFALDSVFTVATKDGDGNPTMSPSKLYTFMEPYRVSTGKFDPLCNPELDEDCDLRIRKMDEYTDGKDPENPLYLHLINCVERELRPYGMNYVAAEEGGDIIGADPSDDKYRRSLYDNGARCVVSDSDLEDKTSDSYQRAMFGLYFIDERMQCILDDNEDCQLEGKVAQVANFGEESGQADAGLSAPGEGLGGVTHYFNQQEEPWASHPYGNGVSGTIKANGCGPTSMAMVVSTLTGQYVTPSVMADYATSNGHVMPGDGGSYWSLFPDASSKYGLSCIQTTNQSEINESLRKGSLVIASMTNALGNYWTYGGHFIVITGVNSSGMYSVADPWSRGHSGNMHTSNQIFAPMRSAWIITNPKGRPASSGTLVNSGGSQNHYQTST